MKDCRLFDWLFKSYKKHTFFFTFVLALIFVVVSVLIMPIQYESNDDITMALLAKSGEYHLVFINVILGYVLSFFYRINNNFEWYTLFLLIIQVVSCSVLLKVIIFEIKSRVNKCFLIIVLALCELYIILHLQFTTTAGMTAVAALALLCSNERHKYLFGMLLFSLASLIRFESAMLCGLTFIFIYPLFIHRFGFNKQLFFSLALCVVLSFAFDYINRRIYHKNSEWAYYYDYNKIRGHLNDNPNSWRAKKNLPVGIEKETYELLIKYFFPDASIINLETLQTLRNTIDQSSRYKNIPRIKCIKNIPMGMQRYKWAILVLLPMFIQSILYSSNRKEKWLWIPLILSLPILVSIISMNAMLKERAFFCSYSTIVFFSMLLADRQTIIRPTLMSISYFIIFAFLILSIFKSYNLNNNVKQADLITKGIIIGDINTEYLSPWELHSVQTETIKTGWLTGMPNTNSLKSYLELIDNPEKCISINWDYYSDFSEKLVTSIEKQYGIPTIPFVIETNESYITFYLTRHE